MAKLEYTECRIQVIRHSVYRTVGFVAVRWASAADEEERG